MRQKVQYVIGVLFLCVVLYSSAANAIATTDEQLRAIADPLLDTILEGLATDNYPQYSKNFDSTLRKAIPHTQFLNTNRRIEASIGNYVSREYLGSLVKGTMTVVLWKARFDKSKDDILIKLVISPGGEHYVVTGLWFQ